MNYIQLPPELAGLEGKVQWVQQVNSNEYHMSCPNCGVIGTHTDGTPFSDYHPSNRFIVWMESRSNGKPFGMCVRHCGYKWTPDKSDAVWTEEEKAAFVAKRREINEREEERIRKYAEDVVMKQRVYVRYINSMKESQYGKMYLHQRGFTSDRWNEYFGFGIFEDYKCRGELDTYYSPAITMPIIGLGGVVEQVKLRVTEAHHEKDRFRNLYKTNAQHPYFPMKDIKIENKVAIFEGEMKSCRVAMAKAKSESLPNDVQIIATQGKGVGARMVYKLEKAEVIYLCLDPDAFAPNKNGDTTIMQAARKFGYDRVRIIPCRQKIDDALQAGFNLRNAFNMAVKPIQLGLKQ
jgi:hypothetical protein